MDPLDPNSDRPAGMTPVEEVPPAGNIPYRGIVDHGIAPGKVESEDEAHYWTGRPVEYMPEEHEPDPIPVRVVHDEGGHELRQFSATQPLLSFSNGNSQQRVRLAGKDSRRTQVKIRCIGRTDFLQSIFCYIGGPNVGPFDGYLMVNSQEVTIVTTEEIWAYADTAHQPSVIPAGIDIMFGVVQEFSEGVK